MVGDGLYLKQGVKLLAAMVFFSVQIVLLRTYQFSVGCCKIRICIFYSIE